MEPNSLFHRNAVIVSPACAVYICERAIYSCPFVAQMLKCSMKSLLNWKHRVTLRERFEEKYIPVTESGCWLWVGAFKVEKIKFEYGVIVHKRKICLAHRIAYEIYKGPIPNGMSVLHRCDVTCCVNPDHLFLGTRADNVADMDRKKRRVVLYGTLHKMAKVTEDQVRTIRASAAFSHILAKQYSCSSSLIRRIKRRDTWRHVT